MVRKLREWLFKMAMEALLLDYPKPANEIVEGTKKRPGGGESCCEDVTGGRET